MRVGLVVTPSNTPRSYASWISLRLAVSMKNFMLDLVYLQSYNFGYISELKGIEELVEIPGFGGKHLIRVGSKDWRHRLPKKWDLPQFILYRNRAFLGFSAKIGSFRGELQIGIFGNKIVTYGYT